jgi:hypothetical protein
MAATPSLTEPWWRCVPSLPTGQAQKNKRVYPSDTQCTPPPRTCQGKPLKNFLSDKQKIIFIYIILKDQIIP